LNLASNTTIKRDHNNLTSRSRAISREGFFIGEPEGYSGLELTSPEQHIIAKELPAKDYTMTAVATLEADIVQDSASISHDPIKPHISSLSINTENDVTEVNIRQYIMVELDKLYSEGQLCTRPMVVDDETGNSIQVQFVYYTPHDQYEQFISITGDVCMRAR
jgi:hypothetical protein